MKKKVYNKIVERILNKKITIVSLKGLNFSIKRQRGRHRTKNKIKKYIILFCFQKIH